MKYYPRRIIQPFFKQTKKIIFWRKKIRTQISKKKKYNFKLKLKFQLALIGPYEIIIIQD